MYLEIQIKSSMQYWIGIINIINKLENSSEM